MSVLETSDLCVIEPRCGRLPAELRGRTLPIQCRVVHRTADRIKVQTLGNQHSFDVFYHDVIAWRDSRATPWHWK